MKMNENKYKPFDPEYWCVLYTRPNFEKRVDNQLKEIGFISYLALHKELRYWNDRKAWIESPLFKSYVFIKTSIRRKDFALKVIGAVKYIYFGSRIAVLKDYEIERIKQLCQYQEKVSIEYDILKVGQKVEISSGVLKGLTGYLTEIGDKRKVRIQIESLNCFVSIVTDIDSVALKFI